MGKTVRLLMSMFVGAVVMAGIAASPGLPNEIPTLIGLIVGSLTGLWIELVRRGLSK
jgi:hypothetical protein